MKMESQVPMQVRLKNTEFHLNTPDLLPDELTYSYLIRFCLSNSCQSLAVMMNLLKKGIPRKRGAQLRKDVMNSSVDDLFELSDGVSLFSKTSTVFPLKFLLSEDLANMDLSKLKNKNSTYYMEPLRLCPHCVKDDLDKYGTCYYHRMHHIPGVTVCAYHGCALWLQDWDDDDCCDKSLVLKGVNTECKILPDAEGYAEFIKSMLESPDSIIGLYANDTIQLAKKRMDYINLGGGVRPTQKEISLYSSGIFHDLSQVFRINRALNPRGALYALFRMFESFEAFASSIKDYLSEKEFRSSTEKMMESFPDYKFLEVESRNGFRYIKVQHEECGNTFWRGISEFTTRTAKCPFCRKAGYTPEGFRNDFEKDFGSKFVLESDYVDSKTALTVGIKGSEIKIKEQPGKLVRRLRWLMEDEAEMQRLLATGVVRDRVNERILMWSHIESNFKDDEPFLTSMLPSNPEMGNIMKGLCDRGKVHRIAPGLYAKTPISMSPDEIIDFRYIRNKYQVFGLDIGDRFLEEVIPGFTGDKTRRTIVTNSERNVLYHRLEVVIDGIKCSIYRANIHIDETNYKTLTLIEFFRHEDVCTLQVGEEEMSHLAAWAIRNQVTINDIHSFSDLCTTRTKKRIKNLVKEMKRLCQENR